MNEMSMFHQNENPEAVDFGVFDFRMKEINHIYIPSVSFSKHSQNPTPTRMTVAKSTDARKIIHIIAVSRVQY